MSGNLRLKGATSGSSQLSAPDTGTDQQFTFPAVGGTLATVSANGQVPGYQTGTIVPDLRRYNASYGVVEVPASIQTSTRRNGKYTRIGNLVTYSFDWAGTIEWGVVNGESWKNDEFVFTAPYGNTESPFIQSNGVYRVWNTKIPHGPDTFCSGVLATALNPGLVGFQEIFNTGTNSLGGSWDLWRCDQTSGAGYEIQSCLTFFTDDTTWQPLYGATPI